MDRDAASLDATAATNETHSEIFHGDDDAYAKSGVRTIIPIMESWPDIRAAALSTLDDCARSPMERRSRAVRSTVEREEASCDAPSDGGIIGEDEPPRTRQHEIHFAVGGRADGRSAEDEGPPVARDGGRTAKAGDERRTISGEGVPSFDVLSPRCDGVRMGSGPRVPQTKNREPMRPDREQALAGPGKSRLSPK